MTGHELTGWLESLAAVAEGQSVNDLALAARRLKDKYLAQDWYVLLLGETSSGKSTWLNSLLGEHLLPATPEATTGVAVEIRFAEIDSPGFSGTTRQGETVPLDRGEFQAACLASGSWARLGVTWPVACVPAERVPRREALRGLVLIDAPGYNSCRSEHSDILTAVLPEADAVVTMLNFRRGVTPEDTGFLKLLMSAGGVGAGTLHFGVNWLPTTGGEKQLAAMEKVLARAFGESRPLAPLPVVNQSEKAFIWSPVLWEALEDVALAPSRAQAITENTLHLSGSLLRQLEADLRDRLAVMGAKDAQLDLIRERIAEIRTLETQASQAIDQAETDMASVIDSTCRDTRDQLWAAIDEAIEEANRFTDASSCSAFVKTHLVPLHLSRSADTLKIRLWERSEQLGDELDRLHAELDEVRLPPIVIEGPQFGGLRDMLAAKAVKKGSEEAFKGYLGQLGGAAGAKAGFVNLAKKVTKHAGELVGKRFSREFYNQMGGMLRRVGLNAGLATAAIGAVVVEIASYLYQVWRWKGHLRGMIQRALGLPPVDEPIEDRVLNLLKKYRRPALEEMAENTREGLGESMAKTRELVAYNFGRRANGLEQALEDRRRMGGIDPGPLEQAAKILDNLSQQWTHWQQGGIPNERTV